MSPNHSDRILQSICLFPVGIRRKRGMEGVYTTKQSTSPMPLWLGARARVRKPARKKKKNSLAGERMNITNECWGTFHALSLFSPCVLRSRLVPPIRKDDLEVKRRVRLCLKKQRPSSVTHPSLGEFPGRVFCTQGEGRRGKNGRRNFSLVPFGCPRNNPMPQLEPRTPL